jgi:hypothetical protein
LSFDSTRIYHEEHQTEWKNNTILINDTLIYLKFGIADCNSAKYKKTFDVLHDKFGVNARSISTESS